MDVFVAFDIETTGTDATRAHITEIAAYKFARTQEGNWVELGRFSTLVNPGIPIPPDVQAIIPITDKMVAQAPDEQTAVAAFKAFVGDAEFVGHNCSFDLRFISRFDQSFLGRSMLDTYPISRVMLPGRPHYTLVDIVRDQKLKRFHTHPHRAWSDALATAVLFAGLTRAAESLPMADLAALRRTRTTPMWQSFLHEAVRGDGVGSVPTPTAPAEPDTRGDWWLREVSNLHAQPVAGTGRVWRLGDRLRPRSWLQGLTPEAEILGMRATPAPAPPAPTPPARGVA